MSATRSRIRDCIYEEPGIHFNDISRRLDIATGQTQYHLRKLRRAGELNRESIAGRTHYYPPTYSDWERRAIALLRRETTREIVLFLLRNGDVPPAEIADQLDLARSTVEWHLSHLVDNGMASKDQTDAGMVVRLTDEPDLYRLLREIKPRLLDRVADRFTRLTDRLLE